MNRQERRAAKHLSRALAKDRPKQLTLIPRNQWPDIDLNIHQVWISSKYLVQVHLEKPPQPPGTIRLSICRTTQNGKGEWDAGLSWDELQEIKSAVGYGDHYAIEIYPRDSDIINVANMRHL